VKLFLAGGFLPLDIKDSRKDICPSYYDFRKLCRVILLFAECFIILKERKCLGWKQEWDKMD
jgi:hypothetical protein